MENRDGLYIKAIAFFCAVMFLAGFVQEHQNLQGELEHCERIARFSNGD